MEIITKAQNDEQFIYNNYENNNIFTGNNYKYIFDIKMRKIKEEIKDYVIDKYTMKIIEQNKEIITIKNQLDDLTKKYINLIKLMIENKNKNIIYDKENFISSYINKNILVTENVNGENRRNNKLKIINKNKSKIEQFEKKKLQYITAVNSTNKINNININNNIDNKFNNYNSKSNRINYLQKLNEKDLKKLNDIKNEIKKNNQLNKKSLNKELYNISKSIYIANNNNKSSLYYNKINIKDNLKRTNNKNKRKIKSFNSEEGNIIHTKKYSSKNSSKIKKKIFKEIKFNNKNYTANNSFEDINKINNNNDNDNDNVDDIKTTSKKLNKNQNNKNRHMLFFYKFKKINTLNKYNSLNITKSSPYENNNSINYYNVSNKSNYICNPIFCSFLNRNEDN